MKHRKTGISRDVFGGCHVCHGGQANWWGKNAQGVAARHHDATGHRTWVEVSMSISYGFEAPVKEENTESKPVD